MQSVIISLILQAALIIAMKLAFSVTKYIGEKDKESALKMINELNEKLK